MTQSGHLRLRDYESLLASGQKSNVIVNPITELVNSMPNFTNRNAQQTNCYQTSYQAAYCQSNQQQTLPTTLAKNVQQTSQHIQQTGQHINQLPNDWQPVSTSSSSTASTALLQANPFQTSLTPSGLNTQLITPAKLITNKLKSNPITIWPINRNKTNQVDQTLDNCMNQPHLISKLNRSSFTYHLLTCALILGIITLLLIVISSICIYTSYANRVSKSAKFNEKELCSSIECHYGARCVVDTSYKQPYCDCEHFQCDNNVISVKPNRTQVVCGSDNKSYATVCELKKAACWRQKRIDVVLYAACVNKNSDSKSSHPNNKLITKDKGKESTFLTSLLDASISADVNILLNDPLAKQEACKQLECSFASSCQIRNVSLSSFSTSIRTEHVNKKSTRLVCECPAKCSLYEHLISELVAEAQNAQMTAQQNQDHYAPSFDYKSNGEYMLPSSSIHQSASNVINYGYIYEQMRNGLTTAQAGAVCGSNARDYKNLCELAKSSCASQTRISIKYFGLCDPCASHQCAEDEICKLNSNRQPYCDCGHRKGPCSRPQKYQNNPEHVCGSDGNTYLNRCVLQRHTCVNERNVSIISNSECVKGFHPCHKIHCNAEMECHVSHTTNQATCECSQHCSPIYKPVCATDNRTYDSVCHLSLETCLRGNSQPRLGLLHAGVCGSNSLSKSTTSQANKNHALIIINEEEHGNIINQLNSLQSNGNQQCAPNTCPNHGICLLAFVNGVEKITCECPTCSLTRSLSSMNVSLDIAEKFKNSDTADGPVCGSDSVSYASECELRKFSCEQQKHIIIKHKGACRGCEQLKCKNYALCETSSSGASECVCPEACEKLDAPVCGSDEISYENECELRVTSCKRQKQILVRSVGQCNICEKIKCKYGATCKNGRCTCPTYCDKQSETEDLLCANNGRTFATECDLRRYACLHQIELHVVHLGECELGSTRKLNSTTLNRDESVEAGVRLINDEENEDEFNVILRQQSAEDESNLKSVKHLANVKSKDNQSKIVQHSTHHSGNHHSNQPNTPHNKHHHRQRNKQLQHFKHHQTSRKQRNQLCRKLQCRYGAVCKLDQTNLNETKVSSINDNQAHLDDNIEQHNRISFEVTAYCDCSHINCDLSDFKDKVEDQCASDGKFYFSACQMKEKACKLQASIRHKQRAFCDSNQQIDSNGIKANESIIVEECASGFYMDRSEKYDSTKRPTIDKQMNEANELDLLFDNYVVSSADTTHPDNSANCVPCECNSHGSIDSNCNQITGVCQCKLGVNGDRCDYCDEPKELTELGCVSSKIAKPTLGICNEINCKYGAICELVGQTAQCKCEPSNVCGEEYDLNNLFKLPPKDHIRTKPVCGSNHIKYANECEWKMHMCLIQEQIDRQGCL